MRKIDSRYQDTDAFDTSAILGQIEDTKVSEFGQMDDQLIAPGIASTEEKQLKRLKVEHLKEDTIMKCAVLLPRLDLPETVQPWCMYHCVHGCPCDKFKNPVDYAPDVGTGRNVAKRTLGGHFKTAKQDSPATLAHRRPQLAKRTGGRPTSKLLVRSNSVGSNSGNHVNSNNQVPMFKDLHLGCFKTNLYS
jgi:hypothetical protein